MLEFFTRLFDTSDFPPRWRCGNWTDSHGWLHILSDIGIWSAYFAIPILLLFFAGRRPDIPFRRVFLLFGAFILACGTTHLLEAIIFWWPVYRFAGLVKLATALISWATILFLIRVIPEALALRSPAMLEQEVARRTAELERTNSELQVEIAERHKLAEELRRVAADLSDASKRKTEFLAILAHELRNPLAPLRSGIDLLRVVDGEPETVGEVLDTMDRQTRHLVHLIDDLLDVSRINQGKLQLRMETLPLRQMLESALESARPILDAAGHALTVEPCPPDIYLHADPVRISQIFCNLLSNAAKYTEDGGQIHLSVTPGRDEVAVAVRDNGIGVPVEEQAHIFDMFAQLNQQSPKSNGGLGIGLTLVKHLAEMHGGRVAVVSEGANRGCLFTVTLPTVPPPATIAPASLPPAAAAPGRRILVVDDNRDAARTLRLMLQRWGHSVELAHDGQEAVHLARELRPEVILMDIGMPILNGYEAARQIRSEPWGQAIQLVALSGWGQAHDRQRALDAGFNHHLVKPGTATDLQRVIEVP